MLGENMNKGFLTIAQNGEHDYVKMAYLLAMSLKTSQEKYNKLSVIVNENEEIPEKYLKLFDNIIYVEKPDSEWKIQNKWRYYGLTPYDETIVLDCDMLFFNDISTWWKCLEDKTLEFTTKTINYRGNEITSTYYRKTFESNNLPNLHTALFYFKKTKQNEYYFRLVKMIFENWEEFYKLLKDPPKFLSGDVAYALAAKVWFNRKWDNFLKFTHMRSRLQDDDLFDEWNQSLPSFFTNYNKKPELKVNNFNQIYPFHYIQKDFITDEVIEFYEDTLRLL
jgi:hypothetical protein